VNCNTTHYRAVSRRSELTKRAGGVPKTERLTEPVFLGLCTTCGKDVYRVDPRTRDGRKLYHTRCVAKLKGKCSYCGRGVYDNQPRSASVNQDGVLCYYHTECGPMPGSNYDATGRDDG